jgi:hypothetical protein
MTGEADQPKVSMLAGALPNLSSDRTADGGFVAEMAGMHADPFIGH